MKGRPEVRKVQITGGATFMVTLPKGWAERVGLRPGSPLLLAPREGALILVPEGRTGPTRALFRLDLERGGRLSGEALAREIISLYIAGFDIIEVQGERISPEERRVIRETTRALIGPEIVEESATTVVIHNLLDLAEVSAERTFERIYLITRSMFADALKALLERDGELARDVVGRDSEVDRLFLMLSRQLRIALQDPLGEGQLLLFDYHTAAKQLERIADHAVKIAQAGLALELELEGEEAIPAELREKVRRVGEAVLSLLGGAAEALRELDLARANRVIDEAQEVQEHLLEMEIGGGLLRIEPGPEGGERERERPRLAQALGLVADSIGRVADYAANIAEVALNAAAPPLRLRGGAEVRSDQI